MAYDFSRLDTFIDGIFDEFGIPGSDCIITEGGKTVYHHSAGYSDLEAKKPVAGSDTHWIYSASKVFTVVAAQQLIAQGKLDPEAPVSDYIPEYKNVMLRENDGTIRAPKNTMLVKHLLTMTGGHAYDRSHPTYLEFVKNNPDFTTAEFAKMMATIPLHFEPGTHFLYSFCLDLIGAIVEIVSGMSFEEYLKKKIWEPLGMKDTTFHPTEEMLSREAQQYSTVTYGQSVDRVGNALTSHSSRNFESGGGGLMSTLEDYIKFGTALALGGVSPEGVRIIDEAALKDMATPRLCKDAVDDFRTFKPELKSFSYGYGVRVLVDNSAYDCPNGIFGWDGAAGAYLSVDMERKICIFYIQQVLNSTRTFAELHQQLLATAYACMK